MFFRICLVSFNSMCVRKKKWSEISKKEMNNNKFFTLHLLLYVDVSLSRVVLLYRNDQLLFFDHNAMESIHFSFYISSYCYWWWFYIRENVIVVKKSQSLLPSSAHLNRCLSLNQIMQQVRGVNGNLLENSYGETEKNYFLDTLSKF